MFKLEYFNGNEWVPAGTFGDERMAWISLGGDDLNYRTVDADGTVVTDKSDKKEVIDKCTRCPACKCVEYLGEDVLGMGFRVCIECEQEWWTDIDYSTELRTEREERGEDYE